MHKGSNGPNTRERPGVVTLDLAKQTLNSWRGVDERPRDDGVVEE
jgi:hypothetical protein